MRRIPWVICLVAAGAVAGCSSRRDAPGEAPAQRVPAESAKVARQTVARQTVARQTVEPKGETPAPRLTKLCRIAAGSYRSFFPGKDEPKRIQVPAFAIEEHAVTNGQFARFVRAVPEWRRSRAKRLFVDTKYLVHWTDDVNPGEEAMDRPVVNVSWFAARAYARWIGRRLPMLQEWELVAAASKTSTDGRKEPGYNERILSWYSRSSSTTPDPVRSTFKNAHGVYDMHGLVWEWVENFNSALVTGESRGDTALERTFFCGAGSIGSADPADYASFMRFAFRSSLKAVYTTKNLGFRCAAANNPASKPASKPANGAR
jgi:formylglycine-generating enzyme required for sulfatase activity